VEGIKNPEEEINR